MTTYQQAKNTLLWVSRDAKSQFKKDKPMIRQIINDTTDAICRDLNLTDIQRDRLSNYACKLHPKN